MTFTFKTKMLKLPKHGIYCTNAKNACVLYCLYK